MRRSQSPPPRKVGKFTIVGNKLFDGKTDRTRTKTGAYRQVDLATLTYLGTLPSGRERVGYYADATRVYCKPYYLYCLDGASPADFEFARESGGPFTRSRGRLFYEHTDITALVRAPKALRPFGRHRLYEEAFEDWALAYDFYEDGQRVYFLDYGGVFKAIEGSTPRDFEVFSVGKKSFFRCGKTLLQRDGKTVLTFDPRVRRKVFSDDYAAVDGVVIYDGKRRVVGADLATFKVPFPEQQRFVALDARQVYLAGRPLKGADPASFAFLPTCVGPRAVDSDGGGIYAVDAKRAYFLSVRNPGRFRVLETKNPKTLRYFVDKKRGNFGFAHDDRYEYNGGKPSRRSSR
jgi:hypothetical protein